MAFYVNHDFLFLCRFPSKQDANTYYEILKSETKKSHLFHKVEARFLDTISNVNEQGVEPLLVFINSKSGGGQGKEVLDELKKYLNHQQIYELEKPGPVHGLSLFRNLDKFKILACGGDGTACWVMSVIEEMRARYRGNSFIRLRCDRPPLGILPLGTGNDLARVLGMGGGYEGQPLVQILKKVLNATPTKLNRWTIQFETQKKVEIAKRLGALTSNNYKRSSMDSSHLRSESNHSNNLQNIQKVQYSQNTIHCIGRVGDTFISAIFNRSIG